MDRIENQKFIISRFDHLYDSINNKGNFLITFQSFLIGGAIVGNRKLVEFVLEYNWKYAFNILSFVLIVFARALRNRR